MPDEITIIKNNHLGQEVWRYRGKVIARTDKGILLEAFFNRPDLEFNGILLKEGDRFLELYPFDKYYNIYEVYDLDSGNLKAWYCNITRLVNVTDTVISYDDLALDLLIYPDKRYLVLDEEEFNALLLTDQERNNALDGLAELKRLLSSDVQFNIRKMI